MRLVHLVVFEDHGTEFCPQGCELLVDNVLCRMLLGQNYDDTVLVELYIVHLLHLVENTRCEPIGFPASRWILPHNELTQWNIYLRLHDLGVEAYSVLKNLDHVCNRPTSGTVDIPIPHIVRAHNVQGCLNVDENKVDIGKAFHECWLRKMESIVRCVERRLTPNGCITRRSIQNPDNLFCLIVPVLRSLRCLGCGNRRMLNLNHE